MQRAPGVGVVVRAVVVVVPVADEETEGEQASESQIIVVQNWFEELKERVPVP